MGFVLAIMVFVYPLALPFATLGALSFAAGSIERGFAVFAVRAAVVLLLLLVLLSPSTASTISGSFLLPWWLYLGQDGVRHYGLHYALACVLLLIVLSLGVVLYRAFAKRFNASPRNHPQHDVLESRYTAATNNAARLFLAGNPDRFACPACGRSIAVKAHELPSITGQRVVMTSCSCGKCSATIAVESLR
jgi:hypothetical protein